MSESFAAQVWKRLSAINVNDHAEKKANLTYLSWSWAWATLMDNYPESEFAFADPIVYPDGTVEIRVSVSVRDGEQCVARECWLPVMDNRNNAVQSPDARKISDAKMRCLVKCLALFGLGHYIYAGEDIPTPEKDAAKAENEHCRESWLEAIDGADLAGLNDIAAELARTQMPVGDKAALRAAFAARKHALAEAS